MNTKTKAAVIVAIGIGLASLLLIARLSGHAADALAQSADALKEQMLQAYQRIRSYQANVSVTAVDKATGKALGEAGRYRTVFDRAQESFRFDVWHKARTAAPDIEAVCNGKTLWFRDARPILDRSGKNLRPSGLALEMPLEQPTNYMEIVSTIRVFDETSPFLALLMGEDPVKELERVMPGKPGRLQIESVPARDNDPLKRPGLKFTGWFFEPEKKSLDAITYWLDPKTHLVGLITMEMKSSEDGQKEIKPLEGRFEVQNQKLNQAIDSNLFTLDMTSLKVVRTYAELIGRPAKTIVGQAAPSVKLQTLEGKSYDLTADKSEVVILEFWATWCGPCRGQLPELQRLYDWAQESRLPVTICAVNIGETTTEVAAFMKKTGLSLPVLMDSDEKVKAAFQVVGIPSTFVIHRGKVVRDDIADFSDLQPVVEVLLASQKTQNK